MADLTQFTTHPYFAKATRLPWADSQRNETSQHQYAGIEDVQSGKAIVRDLVAHMDQR